MEPFHSMVSVELEPLTGLNDLVTMEGQEWKTWRSVFNPGFSAKNLTALLPAFLEEIQVLKERLVKVAAISTNRYEPPDGHRCVTLAHSQTLWPSAFS